MPKMTKLPKVKDVDTEIFLVSHSITNELPRGKPRSIIQLILSILPQQAAGN
jgi:hypothetical protein